MLHYISRLLDLLFFGQWTRDYLDFEVSPRREQQFFVWVESPGGRRFLVQLTKV